MRKVKSELNKEIIVVCIGTDRSTGDSLAPLVGTYLTEGKLKQLKVYGTVDEPIHGLNLEEQISSIKKKHPGAYIIAIDASLGESKSIGKIIVKDTPILPGRAFNRDFMPVGNCSVHGIVNVNYVINSHDVLNSTRLSMVMKLARECTEVIQLLDKYVHRKHMISIKKVETLGAEKFAKAI